MNTKLLIMGVAGCGKSTLALKICRLLNFDLIEGDEYHPHSNQSKMAAGIPLDDSDRWPWLEQLGRELQGRTNGSVLTCSTLKRKYRDLLRSKVPDLRIVYLQISHDEAHRRVASRREHLFPSSLIDSQFAALESPVNEPDVLQLEATSSAADQLHTIRAWLAQAQPLLIPSS